MSSSSTRRKSTQPLRVFVSHAAPDVGIAREIRRLLDQVANVRVFMDYDLAAGSKWQTELRREIENADVVVAVLTPQALESEWMQQEIGAAWALQKRMLPIVTEPAVTQRIPLDLKNVQVFQWKNFQNPSGRQKFIDALQTTAGADL